MIMIIIRMIMMIKITIRMMMMIKMMKIMRKLMLMLIMVMLNDSTVNLKKIRRFSSAIFFAKDILAKENNRR